MGIQNMSDHEYIVSVSDEVLDAMLLAATETYYLGAGRKSNRSEDSKYVEINGYLWGSCADYGSHSYIHIEKFGPSISARKRKDSYIANERSPWLMNSIVKRRSPHMKFLGEIHTHPYKSLRDVESCKGWEFSDGDLKCWPESEDSEDSVWKLYDLKFPLWLVLAVAPMQKVYGSYGAEPITGQANIWQFDIGELRFWIHAEVGCRDEEGNLQFEKNTWLNLYAPFTNDARDRLEGSS